MQIQKLIQTDFTSPSEDIPVLIILSSKQF